MDAAVDGKFTNIPFALPIFTEVFSDKIYDNSIREIYARAGMYLATDPQFGDHGFSTVYAPNKGAGIWIPATRVKRSTNISHWSALDHAVVKITEVRDAVSAKSDYNYKTNFEIWRKNLQFEHQKIARS